ncbi:MAG: DUF2851 family protein [Prevotella sp.]|jgi:hypothetical protein|nr:DUF2851 family protein [Prevotella sp.]
MEQLLHYVWKYRLFCDDLATTDGQTVEVIDAGIHNTNGGPDFFNAKIKVGDKIWAGNVEIHVSSKDWYKHRHNTDPAYNSVILHVVEYADCETRNEAGQQVPQCRITYSKRLKDNVDYLLHVDAGLPCCNYIGALPPVHLNGWLNRMLIGRLERKASDIFRHLDNSNGSWEEVFYILLTRNFGFGLNSDIFERLALSLPLRYIQKQGDSIQQIEALLFGQAGLLGDNPPDEYSSALLQEYLFLKNKYNLAPLDTHLFMRLRVRPSGSPYIRLAQLAMLLHKAQGMFSKIVQCRDLGQIRLLFHENASEYWQTHYSFGCESPRKSKYPGDSSLDVILINTVSPILFAYGRNTGNEELCERATAFLEQIKPESNYITRDFAMAHVRARNAYDSQAMIQLRKEYCDKRKCLYCRVGFRILAEK